MINEVIIEYFQSHKNTYLEFTKGINIIHGASDKGKTAILRGLRWCIYNQPSGDSFISHFRPKDDPTAVTIRTQGKEITRLRQKTDNLYKIDGEEFSGFGRNVPQPIQDLLNCSYINIQEQFDSPFLLSDSTAELTSKLNEIANLSIIDVSLGNISKRVKRLKTDIKYAKKEIDSLSEELKKYNGLRKLDVYIKKLEKSQKEKQILINNITDAKTLLNTQKSLVSDIIVIPDVQILNNLESARERVLLQSEKVFEVKELINKNNELKKSIIEIPSYTIIDDLLVISRKTSDYYDKISIMKELLDERNNLKNSLTKIPSYAIIGQLQKQKERVETMTYKVKNVKTLLENKITIQKQINKINREIFSLKKQFPSVCPTCGKKYD